jgi:hypothetical protein
MADLPEQRHHQPQQCRGKELLMDERARYITATTGRICDLVADWLPARPASLTHPVELVQALRAAQAATTGYTADLWGYAAANADCALWVGVDGETAPELWATALDYAERAAQLTPASA